MKFLPNSPEHIYIFKEQTIAGEIKILLSFWLK
jgi:hypothetical protein